MASAPVSKLLSFVAVVSLLAGCRGVIGDPGASGDEGGSTPSNPPASSSAPEAGDSRLRPLNQREYQNTVADLFGLPIPASLDLPRDQRNARGFDTDGTVTILSERAAEQYFVAAEAIAQSVRDRGLSDFAECELLAGRSLHGCLEPLYGPWLAKAFRSPPADDSVARLAGLVSHAETYPEAIETIAVFTLISPNFLFHYKTAVGAEALDAFEVANRLSYLLWATLPDEPLLAAARDGSLLDPNVRVAEARRLLDDPRSARFITAFLTLWLNVDQLAARGETEEEHLLYVDMVAETMAFGADVFENGVIADLVTADYSFVNSRLAAHYGVDATGLDLETFVRTPMPVERQGILTHASLLAARSPESVSDPIRRGVWTAVEFLCAAPDAGPPPGVPALEAQNEGQTPREILEEHRANPACASCHAHTDPYGLALETFDAVGVYREAYDNGRSVDTTGELVTGERFSDIYELNGVVADSGMLERCVTEQLATYGLGRMLAAAELEDVHDVVGTYLEEAGVAQPSFSDLVIGLVRSPSFVRRGGSL